MNLLIIALVIGFTISFVQQSNSNTTKVNVQSKSKTNCAMQKIVFDAYTTMVNAVLQELLKAKPSKEEALEYLYVLCNIPIENGLNETKMHDNLIKLLSRREMKRRGYSYSHTGRESIWQETKKQTEKYLEEQKKYPWK